VLPLSDVTGIVTDVPLDDPSPARCSTSARRSSPRDSAFFREVEDIRAR
jgi:hypothetical protein